MKRLDKIRKARIYWRRHNFYHSWISVYNHFCFDTIWHFEVKYTFCSLDPYRIRRVSDTRIRQLSLPLRASEVAFGSEVHCVSEVSPDGEVGRT